MEFAYDLDPALLSLDQRIAAVRDGEREIARIHAWQLRLVAAITADSCDAAVAPELDKQFIKEELRAALGESATAIENRIGLAREVTGRLPLAFAALAAGELTLRTLACWPRPPPRSTTAQRLRWRRRRCRLPRGGTWPRSLARSAAKR